MSSGGILTISLKNRKIIKAFHQVGMSHLTIRKKMGENVTTSFEVVSGRSRCAECDCSIKNNLSQAPVAQPTPPELWDIAVWRSRGARTRSRNWPKNDQNIGKSSKFHVFSSFSQVILAVRCSYSPRMLHARSPPILRVWTSSEQYFSSKIMFFNLKTHQNQPNSKIPLYPISKYEQWNSENPDLWRLHFSQLRGVSDGVW